MTARAMDIGGIARPGEIDAIFFDFDGHSLCAKLVRSLDLSHEHNLKLTSLGKVVEVLIQYHVYFIVLKWNMHSYFRLLVLNIMVF